jgi:hypothetical protein
LEEEEHVMTEFVRPPGNGYYTRRESQERRLADRAVDRAVRCAHLSLAEHYAVLAREEGVVTAVGA